MTSLEEQLDELLAMAADAGRLGSEAAAFEKARVNALDRAKAGRRAREAHKLYEQAERKLSGARERFLTRHRQFLRQGDRVMTKVTAETLTDEEIVANAAPCTWDSFRCFEADALMRVAERENDSVLAEHCDRAIRLGWNAQDSLHACAAAINARAKEVTP